MEANNNLRTAIVLQGGGALGAYEFGVLKALYEKRAGFKPAVVTGISIGAICTQRPKIEPRNARRLSHPRP